MNLTKALFAVMTLSAALSSAAIAGPDLKPQFSASSGTVRVTNVGNDAAEKSWVTVQCNAQGGGACPDPAPAAAAPYLNPAFPNKVAIAVPKLPEGKQHTHVVAFFDDLVFAPGSYVFVVCADAGGNVVEDNERNNCIKVQKKVRSPIGGALGLKSNTASH